MSAPRSAQKNKNYKNEILLQKNYFTEQELSRKSKLEAVLDLSNKEGYSYRACNIDFLLMAHNPSLKAAEIQKQKHREFICSLSKKITVEKLKSKLASLIKIPSHIACARNLENIEATGEYYRFTMPHVDGLTLIDVVLRNKNFDVKSQCELLKIVFDLGYEYFLDDIFKLPMLDLFFKKPELTDFLLSEYRRSQSLPHAMTDSADEIFWNKLLQVENKQDLYAHAVYNALHANVWEHSQKALLKRMRFLKYWSNATGDQTLIFEKIRDEVLVYNFRDSYNNHDKDKHSLALAQAWFNLYEKADGIIKLFNHLKQDLKFEDAESLPKLKSIADERLNTIYAGTKRVKVKKFLKKTERIDMFEYLMKEFFKIENRLTISERAEVESHLVSTFQEKDFKIDKFNASDEKHMREFLQPYINLANTRIGNEPNLKSFYEYMHEFVISTLGKLTDAERIEIIEFLKHYPLNIAENIKNTLGLHIELCLNLSDAFDKQPEGSYEEFVEKFRAAVLDNLPKAEPAKSEIEKYLESSKSSIQNLADRDKNRIISACQEDLLRVRDLRFTEQRDIVRFLNKFIKPLELTQTGASVSQMSHSFFQPQPVTTTKESDSVAELKPAFHR